MNVLELLEFVKEFTHLERADIIGCLLQDYCKPYSDNNIMVSSEVYYLWNKSKNKVRHACLTSNFVQ